MLAQNKIDTKSRKRIFASCARLSRAIAFAPLRGRPFFSIILLPLFKELGTKAPGTWVASYPLLRLRKKMVTCLTLFRRCAPVATIGQGITRLVRCARNKAGMLEMMQRFE